MANDHTFRFDDVLHRIEPPDVVAGLRGRRIRVERRLAGTLAAAFQGPYLRFTVAANRIKHAGPQHRQPRRGDRIVAAPG